MGDEADELEAKLERTELKARAYGGIFFVAVGLSGLAFLIAELVWVRHGHTMLVILPVGTIGLIGAGWSILRRGGVDEGEPKPVPARYWVPPAVGVAVVVAGIAAWPLGLYGALVASGTACAELLPREEVERLGIPWRISAAESGEGTCVMELEGVSRRTAAALRVEVQPVEDFARWMRPYGRRRTEVSGLGDRAERSDLGAGVVVGFVVGERGALLQFPREPWDERRLQAALAVLRANAERLRP